MGSSNPTLLVLGAGEDQRFAIETAKEMGCFVIAADINPNASAFDICDERAIVSTRDTKALISFIEEYQKKKNINGVMTMGSDIPMSIAEVSEFLGTPGISKNTAKLASNKMSMKEHWLDDGIPIPWFSEVRSPKHLKDLIAEKEFNLIIKPTDRSGARGITILSDSVDSDVAFENAMTESFEGRVMVEEFITGPQLSTESIVFDDFFYTAGISDRNYDLIDKFNGSPIENGGTMPSELPEEDLDQVNDLLFKAAKSLGIKRGVAKGDVVIGSDGKPKMIEMAARLSGGWMSSGLIPVTSGVNIVKTIIDIAIDREPNLDELKPKFTKHAALRYFFPKPGTLQQISGIEFIKNHEWLDVLEFYRKAGEKISLPTSHGERFGAFLVKGDTREEVINRSNLVYDSIKIRIEE